MAGAKAGAKGGARVVVGDPREALGSELGHSSHFTEEEIEARRRSGHCNRIRPWQADRVQVKRYFLPSEDQRKMVRSASRGDQKED